jgi:outer membrane receptor protein involved in Fe transport
MRTLILSALPTAVLCCCLAAAASGVALAEEAPASAPTSAPASAPASPASAPAPEPPSTPAFAPRVPDWAAGPDAPPPAPRPAAAAHPPPAGYTTVVRGHRPPRSASDFTFDVASRATAAPAAATAGALLRRAPGLHLSQHSGEGKAHQIFLRGFDAVHGQDVAISAGGIPVNEVSNVHGHGYADLHFLPPEAVLRMRVLQGAFDPRQGDFAVAGSIDLDLGLARRGVLSRSSVGSHGLIRQLVGWGPRGQPQETFVLAEVARAAGFGPWRAWLRGGALGQVQLALSGAWTARLLASSYAGRFDSAGVLRLDDLNAGRVGLFDAPVDGQGGASARHQGLLELRLKDGPHRAALSIYVVGRELRLRHNFTGFRFVPQEQQTGAALKPQGDMIEQQNDALTVGGAARYARLLSLLGGVQQLELGVSWRHDAVEQDQRRLRHVDGRPWHQEVQADLRVVDLGLWADLDLTLRPWLRLRAGLRADALAFRTEDLLDQGALRPRREAFGVHVGPKATLELRPRRWLRLFGSYGNGFRSPPAPSLGQGEQATFVTVHAGEVGAAARWSRLSVTTAGFVTHVDEDLLFDHAAGRTLYIGATTRAGVTLHLQARPLRWLMATLSGTWTRAVRVASGETLPYAPPLVARLDLEAERQVGRLWSRPLYVVGDLGLSVVGPRPLPYGEQSRAVGLLELAAGLRLPPVTLSVEAFNLADVRWRDGEYVYASDFDKRGSALPARHLTAGRPLTIQGTVTLLF